MANLSTSATCAATGQLGISVSATVTAGSQSIAENYTVVNYSYSATRTGLTFTGTTRANAGALVLVINGSTVANVAIALANGSGPGSSVVSGSGSVRVYHNADGTKTASLQLRIDAGSDPRGANYRWNSASTSGSLGLASIARASSPSMSASSATIGNKITIDTNRASGLFTHNLWWSCGNSGWQSIATGVGSSYEWTVPNNIGNYITSSTSGSVSILCRTFNGSTQIGSDHTTSFTANIPNGWAPGLSSFSVSEAISNVSSKFGVYVKGASKLNISFSASGVYSSWITSYKITANGQSWNSNSATTDFLTSSGKMTITISATDSRGRSTSTSTEITVVDYGTPYINYFKGIRCNSDGTNNDGGTYLKVQLNGGVYSVNNKNTASYQVGYKESGTNNYTWKTLSISGLAYNSITGVISGISVSTDKSYDLAVYIVDKLGNNSYGYDTLSTEFVMMDFYKDGTGMAIGKVAESSNLFDVGINGKFRKSLMADNGVIAGDSTYFGAPIYGASGTKKWIHLGTWTSGGDAHNCMITVFTGAGYNSNASQNTTIKINIKDGWQSSQSASSSFGITYEVTGNYSSDIKVKGIAQAHDILDIWIYLPWAYWDGDYIFQGFGAWKHIATNQSAEPTGNVQNCAETTPAWIKDAGNGNKLTFSYYKDGMGLDQITWLACWNGSELRAINKNQLEGSGYDSNSGWSWFRSQSGLMIQHKYQTFSKSWKAWGSVYSIDINRQDDGTKEISDYAYKFTQTPTRLVSLADGSSGNAITAFPDADGLKDPTHNFGGIIITRPNNASMTYVLSMMAIGWWK